MPVNCWVCIERYVHKKYRPQLFLYSRAIAVVSPHRRLIVVSKHVHDVPNFEIGIIHPLKGGCAKTINCVGFTTLSIFEISPIKRLNRCCFTGTLLIINHMDTFWGEERAGFYPWFNRLVRFGSDGTLNGALCQGKQHPWHAKHRFTKFRWRVGSWGPPGKLQNLKTDDFQLIYGWKLPIRRKTISNQSIYPPTVVNIQFFRISPPTTCCRLGCFRNNLILSSLSGTLTTFNRCIVKRN